ncbi:MAG: 16S rRNA (guanine(966)-N(2))-methyltransferase RsmD [Alphaproteobacteria bacterium]|jgi:16S rRNA (guanine966-N2)-methyltransferase|nr:16S rRNA (guanine(966)-N(2))-methyltransferase RsmD [Alphaproteobacteria bacterium]MBT5389387.1 16S rRNA (guanine(966)-N(2))-methyltransferase RsmD [Alphaproteobacteria bacterium]MBT5655150.1 16S rRNA (guanine(966)-N(2))-methyltransferase RsmD [Alphaproteobacteria bacterium]
MASIRIISGSHRGRVLKIPPASITRPAMDRVRESVFNIIAHQVDPLSGKNILENAHVLDAFAGSGSMGFEALSRGASHVTFMENNSKALSVLKENTALLRAEKQVSVLASDATHPPHPTQPCTLIFIDPPYGKDLVLPCLQALDEMGWIFEDTLIVCEIASKEKLILPATFHLEEERSYGTAKIVFIKPS